MKGPEHIRKIAINFVSDRSLFAAQAKWAARPLDECIEMVRVAVAIIGQQNYYLDPAMCWPGFKDADLGGSSSEISLYNLTFSKLCHKKKVA